MGGIFLIHNGGELVEMNEQPYDSEDLLQGLIARYPNILAGDQMSEEAPRRWLLISREVSVPGEDAGAGRWSLDHLFLDQDAVPTLVEVKRSSDTRLRREVVGQMLDYAANAIVYWPPETIRAQFEARCAKENLVAEAVLRDFLGDVSREASAFWSDVKTNLQAGRVRLVFVADEIPAELRRIVEFLNGQLDPAEVLAVEIRQFVGEKRRTLVPRLIGQTAQAGRKHERRARQWDEEAFFDALRTRATAAEVEVARNILSWCRTKAGEPVWGSGARSGSFIPVFEHNGARHQLFALFTYGSLELYFFWYAYKRPFDSEERRRELLAKINEVPGVHLPPDSIGKRPSIPLRVLCNDQALKALLNAFEWMLQQIMAENP